MISEYNVDFSKRPIQYGFIQPRDITVENNIITLHKNHSKKF